MKRTFNAVIKQDDGWWIGWVEEIPDMNCQGKTRAELIKILRSVLKDALEINWEDARAAAKNDYEEAAMRKIFNCQVGQMAILTSLFALAVLGVGCTQEPTSNSPMTVFTDHEPLTGSNMLIMTTLKRNGVPCHDVANCRIIRADKSHLSCSIDGQTKTFVRKN